MSATSTPRVRSRWALALIWLAALVAATVLVLGINGTLAAWSAALLTNTGNQAGTGASVVLEESGPGNTGSTTTCTTSGTTSNSADCATINKYGDGGVADTLMAPGDSISTAVTFTNTGTGPGRTFTMTPGTCASVYNAGANDGAAPAAGDDLCAQLQVAVACTGAALTVPSTDLDSFAAGAPYSLTGGLASAGTATCTFTISLPQATPANFSSQTVTQSIAWNLTA